MSLKWEIIILILIKICYLFLNTFDVSLIAADPSLVTVLAIFNAYRFFLVL